MYLPELVHKQPQMACKNAKQFLQNILLQMPQAYPMKYGLAPHFFHCQGDGRSTIRKDCLKPLWIQNPVHLTKQPRECLAILMFTDAIGNIPRIVVPVDNNQCG